MDEFHGRASAHLAAAPSAVFELLTDVDRLPEWNAAIEDVLDHPGSLEPGTEWTVRMHPPHAPSWGSISTVRHIDRDQLHFAYETRNADGNPSRASWSWRVRAVGDGADVTVTWDCYLRTLDRRLLAGPIRKRQLAREVPRSLQALADALDRAQRHPG
jgi:uncharacterized protein YndB with AHSA1/START domain